MQLLLNSFTLHFQEWRKANDELDTWKEEAKPIKLLLLSFITDFHFWFVLEMYSNKINRSFWTIPYNKHSKI